MVGLIVGFLIGCVILVVTRLVWKRAKAEALPEPRRPFMSELEVKKLERELGIALPAPVYYTGPFPNIKRADGSPCYGLTRDDVVAIATELIASGNARDVKTALSDFGVARVTNLDDDQLNAFAERMQEYAEMSEDDEEDLGPL